MFGLIKRKPREIFAPCDGKVIPIEEVDDEVFSAKLAGDGVAIIPIGEVFRAPIDGTVSKLFATGHAYSIQSNKDFGVMVHIGLDTVSLGGEGFKALVEEGDLVKAGDPVVRVDMKHIGLYAKDLVSPIVVTEGSRYKDLEKRYAVVKHGDAIMRVL